MSWQAGSNLAERPSASPHTGGEREPLLQPKGKPPSSSSQQSHPPGDLSSRPETGCPEVAPATSQAWRHWETEPLLDGAGSSSAAAAEAETVPGSRDREEEEEEERFVHTLTTDCPSVVWEGVRDDDGEAVFGGGGRRQRNDVTPSDVRAGVSTPSGGPGWGAQRDAARKVADVSDTNNTNNTNTNTNINTPPPQKKPSDVCDEVRNKDADARVKPLRIDVSGNSGGDVRDKSDVTTDRGDVTGNGDVTGRRKGPSSPPGGVARSFTSACIRTLGEEGRAGEQGEGEGEGVITSTSTTASDRGHRAVRRLSSGDVPHWLPSGQDGSSDVQTMTLVVPGPAHMRESYLIGRANPRGDGALMRMTRMTEVAPTHSSIVDDEDQWKMPLHLFTSKKQGRDIGQCKSKRIRSYYKAQDELITAFEDISLKVSDDLLDTDIIKRQRKLATMFSKITLAVNVALLIGKLVASILSGSISIISSLVDSVVDLLSGIIMWWATRAVKTRDPYTYPQGRTKLEPVAIIILSVVMALASLQLIRESVEKMVTLASDPSSLPRMEAPTFAIAGSTVVVKLVLWLVCRRVRSSIVQALAMDHRNDVLSNTVAIICGYLGSREFQDEFGVQGFIYVDPAGAMLISLYIVINWWQTGSEQIKMLTGHTARPDFLSKLTWTAMNHDPNVRHIDTVRAFHFGNNFLVELDIVLPEDMSLRLAHDIGESLQQKLESIPEVERAFVHLDYEYSHNPNSEHKVV